MLRKLNIGGVFLRATSTDIVKTFYEPALAESVLYQRGTAYFSIEFLLNLMDSLVEFVYRGGSVQLVTSIELDEKTLKAFIDGYLLRDDDVIAALDSKIEEYVLKSRLKDDDENLRLDVIANMIAAKKLNIKVAIRQKGIYHEKIGVFTDEIGDSVAFFGSANETINAFYNNYETLTVGTSWGPAVSLVEEYRSHFSRIWSNNEDGLKVITFPEALEEKIVGLFKKSSSLEMAIRQLMEKRQNLRPEVVVQKRSLYDYQKNAIKQFVSNDYCHLFEMATGTGKTFTAVKAIEQMVLDKKYLNVVVLVPLVDLQHQWEKALKNDLEVSHRIYKFGGGCRDNPTMFRLSTNTASSVHSEFATIAICVYDTYFSGAVSTLQGSKGDTLVIVDEAHNLTPGNIKILKKVSRYRLGLSATPKRYSKKETSLLLSIFLPNEQEPYVYSLEDAIKNGFLSKYEYKPLCVELTDDEYLKYESESKRIAVLYNKYNNDPNAFNKKKLEEVLLARSRIVKKAYNKIVLLDELVASDKYDFHNSVVFCGPGNLFQDGVDTGERIVDQVTRTIGRNEFKRYFPAKYTSGEADRPSRLEGFRQGLTDTLVAVKCFDEGLDVPALDKIYLMASDSSLRQTIQRRGRVLRISKDTGKTIAHIYDMVAGTRIGDVFYPLQSELPRVYEYSRLSINPEESAGILSSYDPNEEGLVFDEIENND